MITQIQALLISVALLICLPGCGSKPATIETPAAPSFVVTNAPAPVEPVTNEFAVLKGRWQRGDGDYLIEVRNADPGGKLDTGYFNPGPIKVSQAQASRRNDSLQIFVELRDVNYPGCTYKLTYDAKSDQLFGQYYQAAMQQTYDVAFGRVK